MAELKFKPVHHSHQEFLAKAASRKGFVQAYDALALEFQLENEALKARAHAGLTQGAEAVGCELRVKLVRQKTA